jgi:hypothetical protein
MMAQIPSRWVIPSVVLLLFMLSFVYPMTAQTRLAEPFLFAESDQGIIFYGLSATNGIESVGKLPSDFSLSIYDATWLIGTYNNLVLSPNQQNIAFTAGNNEGHKGLFTYSLATDTVTVRQVFDEDYGGYDFVLKWSPDSRALLILPRRADTCDCGASPEAQVYDLETNNIHKLTNQALEIYGGAFAWLPDSDGLVYTNPFDPLAIMMIDREGDNRRLLVDLDKNPPGSAYPAACDYAWSSERARLYYIAGCLGPIDDPRDYLYSSDLDGNIQLEAALPEIYTEEFSPGEESNSVEDIDVIQVLSTAQGVYAGVAVKAHFEENSKYGPHMFFRFVALSKDQTLETVFEYRVPADQPYSQDWLVQTALSPDQQSVGLVGINHIVVGNLQSGQQDALLIRPFDSYVRNPNIRWIDAERLLYGDDEADIWLWNTSDNSTVNLTIEMDQEAWMLPQTDSN